MENEKNKRIEEPKATIDGSRISEILTEMEACNVGVTAVEVAYQMDGVNSRERVEFKDEPGKPEAPPKGKTEAPEEEAAVTPEDKFQDIAEEMSRTRHDIAVRAATLMRGACSRKISFNAISKESAGKYIQGIYREIIDSDDFLSRLIDGIEEKKDGVFVLKQIFDEYVANISAEKSSEED